MTGRGGGGLVPGPPGSDTAAARRPVFAGVELPGGYGLVVTDDGAVACLTELADDLSRAGFRADAEPRLATSDLVGRRPLYELELERERLLVRRYHHGGLLRWLTGDRFRDPGRPFRELAVAAHLRAAGVPTPQVLAARARRVGGGWRLEVVTRRVASSIDLGWVLAGALRGELSFSVRSRLVRAVGQLVGRLHEVGCRHADLTPNNMLVDERELSEAGLESQARPAAWILDLDGAAIEAAPLADGARRKNLARLYRFMEGRGAVGDAPVGPDPVRRTEILRFFRGYDPRGARWRADWRAVCAAHERARGAHSLGRLFDRVFSGDRDARYQRTRA